MQDLLNKLSSYNIFNYLFPGVVFSALASWSTHYSFIQSDVITGLLSYYFIGLVISRFGSLIIEPLLKKLSFLQFEEYKNFILASKNDAKLEVLSEVNNTYRTLCSLFVLLLSLKLFDEAVTSFPVLEKYDENALILLLLIMFLFSYRKQTNYITQRIRVNLEKTQNTVN